MSADLINRTCPDCGACGITERQHYPGYGRQTGEYVPQYCPSCGAWLGNKFYGKVADMPVQFLWTTKSFTA